MTNTPNNSQESDDAHHDPGERHDGASQNKHLAPKISRLLKLADQDTPAVDPDFLSQLKERTTKVFIESHQGDDHQAHRHQEAAVFLEDESDPSAEHGKLSTQATDVQVDQKSKEQPSERSNRMFLIGTRVLAASLIGVIVWLAATWGDDDDQSLGKALDQTVATSTLEMELTLASFTHVVQATPEEIRLDFSEGKYQIGNSEATWQIDETRKKISTTANRYFSDNGKLNLLRLLKEIPETEFAALRASQPKSDAVTFSGVQCWKYQSNVKCGLGRCGVTAYVEVKTGLLRQIELLPPDGADRTIARLNIIQSGQPINESLFAINQDLLPAGQIGSVKAIQGHASLRPVMHRRWTLVSQNLPLETGDQVRTAPRGANAVSFQLKGQSGEGLNNVTVGPGSLVELVSKSNLRLLSGDVKVSVQGDDKLTVSGPDGQKIEAEEAAVFRVTMKDGKQILSRLDTDPKWLAGFEGTSQHDPTGSLVATIDGRNVPLTVGYHKVDVDIRDQIARTVIEQSFVNHTDEQLEGVFYFPLPQDASISGFGMWINGELIEADVVEKQRAREIYETILREKRDPGLLEWAGGNIFKARVYPILPNAEKRIKITYTQVLPRNGSRYLYRYGLQSEMLRQNPLRELSVNVTVSSAVGIKRVECKTHETRDAITDNSAKVEFTAQEYTPTKGFEVAIDVPNDAAPVVAIPHRRGNDGYFLLQLTPPEVAQSVSMEDMLERNLLSDGEPLEVLIVADTSASMNESSRKNQSDFIAALIAQLASSDQVNIVAADVEPVWQHVDWQSGGEAAADQTQVWLEQRVSLGWSDLERTFASVEERLGKQTQVIYVGDAMVSTFDNDGIDFADRLKARFKDRNCTFHAVSVGSSFESQVLKGMASVGGGSVRRVSGSRTPTLVASELLGEITSPSITNVQVEFEGVRVAGVYPQSLPNLRSGQQQILLGRYLPQGESQKGVIKISGMKGGTPINWEVPIEMNDAEAGNSFVPRLWARKHLDYLLEQGATPIIKDQIIGLSEEFHIITPYTSLLVLESDADRERFGVKRRYQMRDGEQFFADGRDGANYELIQQQIKAAGTWRLGLQKQVLQHFATLGRSRLWDQPQELARARGRGAEYLRPVSATLRLGDGQQQLNYFYGEDITRREVVLNRLSMRAGSLIDSSQIANSERRLGASRLFADRAGLDSNAGIPLNFMQENFSASGLLPQLVEKQKNTRNDSSWFERPIGGRQRQVFDVDELRAETFYRQDQGILAGDELLAGVSFETNGRLSSFSKSDSLGGLNEMESISRFKGNRFSRSLSGRGEKLGRLNSLSLVDGYGSYGVPRPVVSLVGEQFPSYPSLGAKVAKIAQEWPDDVKALLSEIRLSEQLKASSEGFEVERTTNSFDARFGRKVAVSNLLSLYRFGTWLSQSSSNNTQTIIDWCNGETRSVVATAFEIGSRRKATPDDWKHIPFLQDTTSLESMLRVYATWDAQLNRSAEVLEEGQVLLTLTAPRGNRIEYVFDAERRVLLSITSFDRRDKSVSKTLYSDFVEVGGLWWAQNCETFDQDGYLSTQISTAVRSLDKAAFQGELAKLQPKEDVTLFINDREDRTLRTATEAVAAGQGTLEDHLVRINHFCVSRRWDKARIHMDAIERIAANYPGLKWLQAEFAVASRRHEDLRLILLEEAKRLQVVAGQDGKLAGNHAVIVSFLMSQGSLAPQERIQIQNLLKNVYASNPIETAIDTWWSFRAGLLDSMGQREDATAIWLVRADENPSDQNAQTNAVNRLWNEDRELAFARLEKVLENGPNPENKPYKNPDASRWSDYEYQNLMQMYMNQLRQDGRYQNLLQVCRKAMELGKERGLRQSIYKNYLDALKQTSQKDLADDTCLEWLGQIDQILPESEEVRSPEVLASQTSTSSRIDAAMLHAFASKSGRRGALDRVWEQPLANLVRQSVKSRSTRRFAEAAFKNGGFNGRDVAVAIRKELWESMEQNLGNWKPERIYWHLRYGADADFDKARWQAVCDVLLARWRNEAASLRQAVKDYEAAKTPEKLLANDKLKADVSQLDAMLLTVILRRVGTQAHTDFLRERIELALDEPAKIAAIKAFYAKLISLSWTVEIETETWNLLGSMIAEKSAGKPSGRIQQVQLLFSWVDSMAALRGASAVNAVTDPDKKLKPAELSKMKKDAFKKAQQEFTVELTKREADASTAAWLQKWIQLERQHREVRNEENLDEAREACQAWLGERAIVFVAESTDLDSVATVRLNMAFRSRCVKTLLYLNSMTTATEDQRAWLSAYIDRAVALTLEDMQVVKAEPSGESEVDNTDPETEGYLERQRQRRVEMIRELQIEKWKQTKFNWMMATDQLDALVKALNAWVVTEGTVSSWRHALALLLAERGQLDPAITHFETIESEGELTSSDYRVLSAWYMATDRKADYQRAKTEYFNTMPEQSLRNYLSNQLNRIRGNTGKTPDPLDEDTRFAIKSLLSRTQSPANYQWLVKQLYDQTRDFRILGGATDALVGQSAQSVYRQLSVWRALVKDIRKEATADTLNDRINELRAEDGRTVTDLRALDLLESMIARRSSEIQNQPGPHIQKAVTAMQSAFSRQWQPGERALMAEWLANMGSISNADVRQVQMDQFDALLKFETESDSPFRRNDLMKIAYHRGNVMWSNGSKEIAVRDWNLALDDYVASNKATGNSRLYLSSPALILVRTLVNREGDLRRFAAAEKTILDLQSKVGKAQHRVLDNQLFSNYVRAIRQNGRVSLGQGKELYENYYALLLERLDGVRLEVHRHQLIANITSMFRTACHELPYSSAAKKDFESFAFTRVVAELDRLNNNYANTVNSVAQALHSSIDFATGVRFYVDRYESQPQRVRDKQQLLTRNRASWLINYRTHVLSGSLPAKLEQRLLAIVISELKGQLQSTNGSHRYGMAYDDHSYYWKKHADSYLKAAEEVWKKNLNSGAHASFIADYISKGLGQRDRAIDILKQAYRQGLLQEQSQLVLVRYLQDDKRYAESISILTKLMDDDWVDEKPKPIEYYVRLMRAYFHTEQNDQLQAIWRAADKRFASVVDAREGWVFSLGSICYETKLYRPAVGYIERAIRMRTKGVQKASSSDSTLSSYYVLLSKSYSGLAELQPSLDAANAAVVVWGSNVRNRSGALNQLAKVVSDVGDGMFEQDLDRLVEIVDVQEKESGQYNYLLHKAIGKEFQKRKMFAKAIEQLRLAVELKSNDREIHDALVACYDGAKDPQGAVNQLLELVKLNRRDVALYTQLGKRMGVGELKKQWPGGMERAYTSMVEMLPTESEGHAALAKIRETQKRWSDAIHHWQRVSEIRSNEPTGLINLCRVQINQQQMAEARRVLTKLKAKDWPVRFDNEVEKQIKSLEANLK